MVGSSPSTTTRSFLAFRWEEEKKPDGVKWNKLEHKGPLLAPPYEPLPKSVKFKYDGHEMRLSEAAEEVATFYARMLDHEYTTKPVFNKNFFKDWRKVRCCPGSSACGPQ